MNSKTKNEMPSGKTILRVKSGVCLVTTCTADATVPRKKFAYLNVARVAMLAMMPHVNIRFRWVVALARNFPQKKLNIVNPMIKRTKGGFQDA